MDWSLSGANCEVQAAKESQTFTIERLKNELADMQAAMSNLRRHCLTMQQANPEKPQSPQIFRHHEFSFMPSGTTADLPMGWAPGLLASPTVSPLDGLVSLSQAQELVYFFFKRSAIHLRS